MTRPVDTGLVTPRPEEKKPTCQDFQDLDQAQSFVNDVIALSALSASCTEASHQQIGEILLGKLQSTLRPALSYFFVPAATAGGDANVELAYVDGQAAASEQAERLGLTISPWALQNDPDELLDMPDFAPGRQVRLCAYPLGHDARAGVLAAGFYTTVEDTHPPSRLQRALVSIVVNQAMSACRNATLQSQTNAAQSETEALYEVARTLAAELDVQTILQSTIDAVTRLTGANFGAFFHKATGERGELYVLYTLSGAPREAFDKFGTPRNTELFEHTFRGRGPVRIADVRKDPRYGKMPPHHGMPKGHLPVCSYLAVPVETRNGEVLGGIFLAHRDPGVFTEAAERIAVGIAKHAAVALEMSRLFATEEQEVAQRRQAEAALRESEGRMRLLTDALPALIAYIDKDGHYRFNNRAYKEWFGLNPDELAGKHVVEVVGEEGYQQLRAYMDQALSGTPVSFESEIRYSYGSPRCILGHYVPEVRGDGTVVGFYALVHDITQRKRVEEELREADQRKDEFLSTLGHELRNPLAPIRMAVSILRSASVDSDGRDKAVDILERQSSHLVRLIDDLLDLSRISRGKISLRTQRISIGSVIEQAVDSARALCEGRDLELAVNVPQQPILVEVDPVRVVQIIGNLLSNACKYTRDGGHVQVQAECDGEQAVVRVKDNGIGIAPQQLPRIFEMFAQIEMATHRAPGGLGIGLPLARSLAELHGGTLEGHSDGVGQGSEFVLRLRRISGEAPKTPARTAASRNDAQAKSRRIVAVDDYPDALESVSFLLQLRGHEVYKAVNGEQALQLIEAQRPEIVLLDIGLPDMAGYEVARRIRRSPWGKDILLVAMTGWGQEQDKQRAIDAGFDAHLTKPADPDQLDELLEQGPKMTDRTD